MDRKGPMFKISNGIKYEDPVSSGIFNCVLEEIFRKLDWARKGIRVGRCYSDKLRLVDDIALVSSSREELPEMVSELERASKQ